VYPDSAPEDWQKILSEQLIECIVSPLHNKDVLPTGEPKKPHWHVVLSFKNPTTYEKACEIFNEIGAVIPPEKECKVKDFRQMARYLCHMDQPDKYRYEMQEVITFGSIDYATLCMSTADEDAMLDDVFDAMDTYFLDSYPKVVRFTKEQHPEWKPVVYRKYSRSIAEYAKGLHYESQQKPN
jgi:alpha-N-acetylglucosamine transferase